ncbi:hypothetical protein SLA2020_285960 [Shorea laevis]
MVERAVRMVEHFQVSSQDQIIDLRWTARITSYAKLTDLMRVLMFKRQITFEWAKLPFDQDGISTCQVLCRVM